MSLRHAFSPSGGVVYHLLARKRARSLWRGFRAVVRDWLSPWLLNLKSSRAATTPETFDLLVFGPSAGWTLPLDLFKSLRVLFIEPDPVAVWILKRRLASAGLQNFEIDTRADRLPWCAPRGAFKDFLAGHPQAAILFSNVLGQMPLVASRTEGVASEFLEALATRDWVSYHDVFSGPAKTFRRPPENAARVEASDVFSSGEIVDHETAWLGARRFAPWPLTEETVHLIGFRDSSRSD